MKIIKPFILTALFFIQSLAIADIVPYFNRIKTDPNALYAFLKAMPKGGELHYHLAGGAYPETMIELANTAGDYCLEPASYTITKQASCQGTSLSDINEQPELYNNVIKAWSLKDFVFDNATGHDHFFASFLKFMPVVTDFRPQLLAHIMQRAANQQEQYMEIMVLPDNARSAGFGTKAARHQSIADKRKALLADPDFKANVYDTITQSTRILKKARDTLDCNQVSKADACDLTIKFQYYILREQPLDNLFAQALNGFEAASRSSDIVGINLVQAEDGPISRRDYQKQMALLKSLHAYYPDVHIALHAGELNPEAVSPRDLRFHIQDAIFTGQAERIGHGVSIAFENNATDLLGYMAKHGIPVEINLTSNQKILNIKGQHHPLNYYLNNQVPVVLSTDDEGILRTDLTREYVKAVLTHGIDYNTLKNINRNTLTYSFLPGKSLWKNSALATVVKPCQTLGSTACKAFISQSEKARLQWQLEKKLSAFEAGICKRSGKDT